MRTYLAFCLVIALSGASALGTTFSFTKPLDREIVQRDGADVGAIKISGPNTTGGVTARAMATVIPTYAGTTTGWTSLSISGGVVSGTLIAVAGWYSVTVEVYDAGPTLLSTTTQSHVGVGDIFITAGQSNAANYYQPINSTPPDDRVNCRGTTTSDPWRLATDPQPSPLDGTFSSVWPSLGNLIVAHTGFPVGFISVAQGNTTVANWQPGGSFYPRIRTALSWFPAFGVRAILWHQGETDAALSTSQASYTSGLENIIDQSRVDAAWPIPWGVAIVSHPNEATGAGVTAAQAVVGSTYTHVWQGANTDTLDNTYRGADHTHFNTTSGQAAHAALWYNTIINQIFTNVYAPIVIDSVASKLCFYNAGWKCVAGL